MSTFRCLFASLFGVHLGKLGVKEQVEKGALAAALAAWQATRRERVREFRMIQNSVLFFSSLSCVLCRLTKDRNGAVVESQGEKVAPFAEVLLELVSAVREKERKERERDRKEKRESFET